MQIVDIAMVGRLGPEAIGAVGVGSALFLAFGVFGMGLLLGLDTLVSQAFGARNRAACDRWLRHGVVLALALTLPLGLLARIAGSRLDVWGFDPAVLVLVRSYFAIVAWSLPLLLLYAAFRRYLQAVSVVQPIMLALVTANVVNAAANWVLISGNLGAPALGVDGAGWATCISRAYMVIVLAVAVSQRGVRPWTLTAGVRIAGLRRILGLGVARGDPGDARVRRVRGGDDAGGAARPLDPGGASDRHQSGRPVPTWCRSVSRRPAPSASGTRLAGAMRQGRPEPAGPPSGSVPASWRRPLRRS